MKVLERPHDWLGKGVKSAKVLTIEHAARLLVLGAFKITLSLAFLNSLTDILRKLSKEVSTALRV